MAAKAKGRGKRKAKKPGRKAPSARAKAVRKRQSLAAEASPRPVPTNECPVCGSRNVHYNKQRAELVCRECGEIHAQIV
jgi:hypothetical protein